ncbi:MAG TPA: hypothetical protein VNT32_14220 [Thermoleophilaceae bacterium]|nr:hypothetical protein [Thermoleophilaceae bacterium]
MASVEEYEARFRRAGLPLFIRGYTATDDVFTRAAPLLAIVLVAELLGAIDLDWTLAANLGAAAGGLAILVGGFALLNRARGRPALALPEEVGRVELTAFVLLPALLPVVFGGQVTSAFVTAAGNVLLLALFAVGFGFALFSMLRWAGRQLFRGLATSFLVLSKAVPLLMIFAIVLFINTEMWQVFSTIPDAFLVGVGGLFAALGTLFLVARLPREVQQLEREAGGTGPELARQERLNVGLVMFVSQALQVLVVTAAVGAFFTAFGALAVGAGVRESWIGSAGDELLTLAISGERLTITTELLKVSAGIAAFSGLYYAIAVLTDSTYREEFLEDLTDEMRETFRQRAEYLALVAHR